MTQVKRLGAAVYEAQDPIVSFDSGDVQAYRKYDYCLDSTTVVEYYCTQDHQKSSLIHSCLDWCDQGVCTGDEHLEQTQKVSFWEQLKLWLGF